MTLDAETPQFKPEIYNRIALNELVVYAVYYLSQTRKEISAEDIVAACFNLFPERFQLRGYPHWPDSTVVNKRWIDCRDKGYLQGSTAAGFSLTPKGLELAEKAAEHITGKRPHFGKQTGLKVGVELRTRAGRFVQAIENSDAFRLFLEQGEAARIQEFDFRNMLLCTMESSPGTLRNNLDQFEQHAALYKRTDQLLFLQFCRKRFANLLSDITSVDSKYRGGMLKQKVK
jgi:hypothetical protein